MSDNDLIRRGDALKALHYDVGLGTAHPAYECIAALPAVTPALGLKHIGTGLYETQSDYRLAPHLQKIVDGAKTAPQWDTQADRLAPTDAATQKGGDAHDRRLRSHEASPGVTAGADAAQAREAALRELIDAYEDIMDYGIVFAKKPQQDRLNAAKEKLKETQ